MRFIQIVAIACAIGCISCSDSARRTPVVVQCRNLSCIDTAMVRTFLGKPIENFVKQIDDTLVAIHTMTEPPMFLRKVVLNYSNGYHIYVDLDSVRYQPRYREDISWDSAALLKEHIYAISIWKGPKSIVGGVGGVRW